MRLVVIALVVTLAAGIGAFWFLTNHRPEEIAASILEIDALPASAQDVVCWSPFTTDVITYCHLRIDPSQFDLLLDGRPFEQRTVLPNDRITTVIRRELRRAFEPAMSYTVQPPSFTYGGHVQVFANESRTEAVVHIYVE